MTPTLLSQLAALEAADPAYAQAARNVREDLRSTSSPNGNIREGVASAIEAECCNHGKTARRHLRKVIEAYRTHEAAAYADNQQSVPPDGLATVVPMSTFISYHAAGSTADSRQLLKSKKRRERLRDALFDIPKVRAIDASYKVSLGRRKIKGTTSAPRNLTWWTETTLMPNGTAPGKTVMCRLALSETTLLQAERDGHVVFVTMPEAGFNNSGRTVYKPSALDGYCRETKFRPELSGMPHGLTCPDDDALAPLPELVSASISYINIGKVEVTLFAVPFE
jgi:hypothetical protein